MKTLLLIVLLALQVGLHSSEEKLQTANLTLTYLKTEKAQQALAQIFGDKLEAKTTADGKTLSLKSTNLQIFAKALTFLAEIDSPGGAIPTSWIELKNIETAQTAEILLNFLTAESIALTVTPDSRTNRIFLMGPQENIAWATAWLNKADN